MIKQDVINKINPSTSLRIDTEGGAFCPRPLWRVLSAAECIKFLLSAVVLVVISSILQLNLIIPVFLLTLALYIFYRKKSLKDCNMLNLTLLFIIISVTSYIIINRGLSRFYIPICIVPMLVTLLFNQLELSLLMSLAIAVVIASISGNHLHLGVLFLVSGILSSLLVWNARRRMTIIRAGFLIGILQAVLLFFIDRFWIGPPEIYLKSYLIIMLNGFVSSIIVIGVLPLFEWLFKRVTNISLLELADFHHPLLQRMVMEAPGTHHHSLVVGNLSDAACSAIGANALLARIGAYYHDIGKLQKPGYFSENQSLEQSKHDTLAPSMSKMVIMNHVKEGVELARKYRLNPFIIDFIQQHHGSSLVFYFYRRALEELEDAQEVKEEGFRYPGPKPNTKEAAIVLLADSVEAATRALKDPAPPKITEVVHKVINNKFIDGQLDECELTLNDLEKISKIFIRILSGIYHSRVTYPEESRSDNNHKKPSKQDSHPA
ncbi:MAG: HDIG domain-containing protein [Candidatus Omnitrophica bacterium]|nr:HDIG domain-containing protein [Candidatus Omnitrophota bacterium]MBL7210504.1 HDIG domain-containing protein [Candidatus Omnitrophota bacterium]